MKFFLWTLLAVALGWCWGTSYTNHPIIAHENDAGLGTELISYQGCCVIWHFRNDHDSTMGKMWKISVLAPARAVRLQAEYSANDGLHFWHWIGFLFVFDTQLHSIDTAVSIPYWLMLVGLLLLLRWLRSW